MIKFTMCQGLPGSGKSTWAQSQIDDNTVEVNCEEIRKELGLSSWAKESEWFVRRTRNERLKKALKEGKSVISSDLNFNPHNEIEFREMAIKFGAEFEIKVFDTPVEECIRRDALRTTPVGSKEILKIAKNHGLD